MATATFDRDAMANWYAKQHLKVDPGVSRIYYLRGNAPDREIRLIEVNDLMVEMKDESLEPLDFGIDTRSESAHKLLVLDVTPRQWRLIKRGELSLPKGWELESRKCFRRKAKTP